MMRPMKLAGSQLMFGEGCLAFLETLPYRRAMIVIGGSSMEKSGILRQVEEHLHKAGAETGVFRGVEPDPSFATVQRGARAMREFAPDLIVALGGGSAMDAAKMMWVYYEHPQFTTLEEVLTADPFPTLRNKARLCCIPSTAGTASEVSRSVVISDERGKHGLGNMEMMPDIAICDPAVTRSMPPPITAETGMDAMTHALEALVSSRANYVSDILCKRAIEDIRTYLPRAYADGDDMEARETMLNASMIAGMAFTNVSLGIVHSIAHAVGGMFHVSHGMADAILLPYILRANNKKSPEAAGKYRAMADKLGTESCQAMVEELNRQLNIPKSLSQVVPDESAFMDMVPRLAQMALADGCTKTNPFLPTPEEMQNLMIQAYRGQKA